MYRSTKTSAVHAKMLCPCHADSAPVAVAHEALTIEELYRFEPCQLPGGKHPFSRVPLLTAVLLPWEHAASRSCHRPLHMLQARTIPNHIQTHSLPKQAGRVREVACEAAYRSIQCAPTPPPCRLWLWCSPRGMHRYTHKAHGPRSYLQRKSNAENLI